MRVDAGKTQKDKRAIIDNNSQKQPEGSTSVGFDDNRPEAVAQLKLKNTANKFSGELVIQGKFSGDVEGKLDRLYQGKTPTEKLNGLLHLTWEYFRDSKVQSYYHSISDERKHDIFDELDDDATDYKDLHQVAYRLIKIARDASKSLGNEELLNQHALDARSEDGQKTLREWKENGTIDQFVEKILSSSDVPIPPVIWQSTGWAGAQFNISSWKIGLNRFDHAQPYEWRDLAALLYHECRHVEQETQIVRGMLKVRLTLAEINARTTVPLNIITAIQLTGNEFVSRESRGWHESMHGGDAEKRAKLYGVWNELEALKKSVHDLIHQEIDPISTLMPPEAEGWKKPDQKYHEGYLRALTRVKGWFEAFPTAIQEGREAIARGNLDELKKFAGFLNTKEWNKGHSFLQIMKYFNTQERTVASIRLFGTTRDAVVRESGRIKELAPEIEVMINRKIEEYMRLPEEVDAYSQQGKFTAAYEGR